MVLYNANPKLRYKTVTLENGQLEYLKNCTLINNTYLLKKDCVKIKNTWFSKKDPLIEFDHETEQYFLKSDTSKRIYGVIDVNLKTHELILGYFTHNPGKNIPLISKLNDSRYLILDEKIVEKSKNFVLNVSEGVWYYVKEDDESFIKTCGQIYNFYDWKVKQYNIEENESDFKQKAITYKKYPHIITEAHRKLEKLIRYSFGFEFEVAKGFVPDYLQNRNGVVICRDGSIDGGMEAVTIPMEGSKGISAVSNLCNIMKNKVILDIKCSTHLHLGKFNPTKQNIVFLYELCVKIQNDVFSMLPPYKTYWEGFKKKNYCKKLDLIQVLPREITDAFIEQYFKKIYSFASDFKMEYKENSTPTRHPSGHKWDVENRKCWINFVNLFFSNRKTVEFRAHQATFNETKTINWLLICSAILLYVEHFGREILLKSSISLKDVLNIYRVKYPSKESRFVSQYLIEYYESRKKEFSESFEKKDFTCNWDLKDDAVYDFKMDDKNLLS